MKTYAEVIAVCKLLGDKTRLEIVQLLLVEEQCICDLVAHFGISQPAVSKHIKKLKAEGMLIERKQAQWNHYRFNRAYRHFDIVEAVCNDLEASRKNSNSVC
ncbi:MAG: ArsR/SmtB family transcription factor [Culicoidibacterales bacterium]